MIGDLISGGLKFVGGLMGQNEQENANAANQAQNQLNLQYQHLANTHGIRWKVQDAIAAGLHPLAALGVSPASGPPASIGQQPATGMSDALSNIGQDISRAINATRTEKERERAYANQLKTRSVADADLDLEFKQLRNAKLRQDMNPPFPAVDSAWSLGGQGNALPWKDSIKIKPFEYTPSHPEKPSMEPAPGPDVGHTKTPHGYAIVPSEFAQNRMEDIAPATLSWGMRNLVMPIWDKKYENPPPQPAPEGYEWRFHWPTFSYRPARRRGIWKEWKD